MKRLALRFAAIRLESIAECFAAILIIEARRDVRDGELVVAEGDGGAVVGRYVAAQPELLVHPLHTQGGPQRVQRQSLRVRGVVIGVRSAL